MTAGSTSLGGIGWGSIAARGGARCGVAAGGFSRPTDKALESIGDLDRAGTGPLFQNGDNSSGSAGFGAFRTGGNIPKPPPSDRARGTVRRSVASGTVVTRVGVLFVRRRVMAVKERFSNEGCCGGGQFVIPLPKCEILAIFPGRNSSASPMARITRGSPEVISSSTLGTVMLQVGTALPSPAISPVLDPTGICTSSLVRSVWAEERTSSQIEPTYSSSELSWGEVVLLSGGVSLLCRR
jgi:hypothetical protein